MLFTDALRPAMVTKEAPGDYTGPDGLLYCGKCHTPKQALLKLPALTGTDEAKPFPINCACEQERIEQIEAKRKAEQFKINLEVRWERDGFHDGSYLNPTFSDDDGANPKLTAVCKKYVDSWPDMLENGMGLLLYGGVGSGKTFLAGCVCNALIEKQVTVCATSFPRILNTLQNSMERQTALDRLSRYQCVLLDDFGVERGTEYATEQVFSVVDARYRAKRPTIVTTNLSLKELENPQNLSHSRIFDRLLELCPIRLCVTGSSRRKGLADSRAELARELLL